MNIQNRNNYLRMTQVILWVRADRVGLITISILIQEYVNQNCNKTHLMTTQKHQSHVQLYYINAIFIILRNKFWLFILGKDVGIHTHTGLQIR